MANFFDQFDEETTTTPLQTPSTTTTGGGNFFDQFDEPETKTTTIMRDTYVPVPERVEGDVYSTQPAYYDEQGQAFSPEGMPMGNKGPQVATQVTPQEFLDKEGDVSASMYDGLTYSDALQVYEMFANDPAGEISSGPLGETLTYNGFEVPFPSPDLFGNATVGQGQLTADGLESAFKGVANTIMAGVNQVGQTLGSEGDVIPLMDDPQIKPDGIADSLNQDVLPLLASGVGGTAVATKGMQALGKAIPLAKGFLNRFLVKGAGATAGGVGGTVAVMDDEDSGLFTGEDAAVADAIQILSRDPETDTPSDTYLANKLDLMADGFATTVLAGGILTGTKAVVKDLLYDNVFGPMLQTGQPDKQAKQAFLALVESGLGDIPAPARGVRGIDGSFSESEPLRSVTEGAILKDKVQLAADIIRANRKVSVDTAGDGMAPYKRPVNGQIPEDAVPRAGLEVDLGPLDALKRGLTDPETRIAATQVDTLRGNIYGGSLPEPLNKLEDYRNALGGFTEDIRNFGGNEQGAELARAGIVKSGLDEVAEVGSRVADIETEIGRAESVVSQALKMDATFGKKLTDLGQETNIDVFARSNATTEQIADAVVQAGTQMKTEMDDAYARVLDVIPEDLQFQDPLFDDYFSAAKQYLPNGIQVAVEDMTNNSFKFLQTDVLPAVNSALRGKKPGDMGFDELVTLKQNIQLDQLEALGATGTQISADIKAAIGEAGDAARKYYSWFGAKDSPLKGIMDESNAVITFRNGEVNPASQAMFRENTGEILSDTMSDNTKRYSQSMIADLLATPEGGRNQKLLVDLGIARLVEGGLGQTARSKGIKETSSEQIIRGLEAFGSTLTQKYPDQAKRITAIVNNIRRAEGDQVRLTEQLQSLKDEFKDTEARVMRGELGAFFKGSGAARVEQTNADEIFRGLFDNAKGEGALERVYLRAAAAGDEQLRGLQGSFGEYLSLNSDDVIANGKQYRQAARVVFQDKPRIADAIDEGLRLAEALSVPKGARIGPEKVGAQADDQLGKSIKRLVTMTLGVLNPAATRANAIGSIIKGRISPKDDMVRMVGAMASDSDRFLQMADQFVNDGAISDPKLLFQFMTRAGIYSGSNEEYVGEFLPNFEDQMASEMNGEEGPSVDEQTEQMLSIDLPGPQARTPDRLDEAFERAGNIGRR